MSSTNKNVPYGIYPVDTTTRYYDRVPVTVVSGVTVQANTPYKYHTDNVKVTPAGQSETPSGVIVQVYRPNGDTSGLTYGEPADSSVLAADNDGTCLAMVTEKDSPHVTFQSVVAYNNKTLGVGDRFSYNYTLGCLVFDPSGPFIFVRYANKTAFSGSESAPFCSVVVKVTTADSTFTGTAKTAAYDASAAQATLTGKTTGFDFTLTSTVDEVFKLPASDGTGASAIASNTVVVARLMANSTKKLEIIASGTGKKVFKSIADTDGTTGAVIGKSIAAVGDYAVLVPVSGGNWAAVATKFTA